MILKLINVAKLNPNQCNECLYGKCVAKHYDLYSDNFNLIVKYENCNH